MRKSRGKHRTFWNKCVPSHMGLVSRKTQQGPVAGPIVLFVNRGVKGEEGADSQGGTNIWGCSASRTWGSSA